MTIDNLRQVPLFESLDDDAAKQLCELLETLDCEKQKVLFRAGETGDAMYLIERGKVRISVDAADGRELTLTELGRGDFFGEMALLNVEEAARLTFADRAADILAEFGGSWKFILSAVVLLNVWVLLNTWLLMDKGFDPYPYLFLCVVLNMLQAVQAPIIMMSQNRQSHKDRLRSDLDYQLNLKNELALQEILERLKIIERDYLRPRSQKQHG